MMRADVRPSRNHVLAVLARAAAWASVAAIIVVSVIPGGMRPHMMADKHHEHFVAYFLCAGWFCLRYPKLHQVVATGVMLAALSGLLEVVQSWIPGRTPSLADWVSSASGACCGLALAGVLWHLFATATTDVQHSRTITRRDRRTGEPGLPPQGAPGPCGDHAAE